MSERVQENDMDRRALARADRIAGAFHEAYERLAPCFGYETRRASAVPWEDVPDENRRLMRAVARDLLDQGVVRGVTPLRNDSLARIESLLVYAITYALSDAARARSVEKALVEVRALRQEEGCSHV